ncbi:uncharacterized protein DS421_11g327610 [Arachis hypogaea]|nr:uncharacterized protein DS421_11g327610 [Arachis hypogaea]
MENDGKDSYKNGDQYEDLSVEYECSSDENDDMVDVTVDKAEADLINVDGFEKLITELTIEDIWGLVFDTESQVCEFYGKYAKCYEFVSRKDLKTHSTFILSKEKVIFTKASKVMIVGYGWQPG